jgi:hypothetical protein
MSPLIDAGFIVLGLLLIGASRTIADGFKINGDVSTITRLAGLGDTYNSRLYRWATASVAGLVFVVVGIADVFS